MRPVNPKTVCLTTLLRPGAGALRQVADDEAACGAPEHSLSGNAQTSRRRLAMTHRHGRNISAHPTRGFSR